MVKLLNVVRNPLTNNVINTKLLGATFYRRGFSKDRKTENKLARVKYLFNVPEKYTAKKEDWALYDVTCPSCGHKGSVRASEATVISCPHCKESFKLSDASHKLIVEEEKEPQTMEDRFKMFEKLLQPLYTVKVDDKDKSKKDGEPEIIWNNPNDFWFDTKTPLEEPNFDAINGKTEFRHRLAMHEPLGVNFKEAAKHNKEIIDREIMEIY